MAAHTIVNDDVEKLLCLVMGQRLRQDVSDYPNQGKRLYRNNGDWNLVDIQHISDPKNIKDLTSRLLIREVYATRFNYS
jgi:uncharacterized cupin superfamily protein